MNEIEYYEMQEEEAMGRHMAELARAIFDVCDETTMGGVQRTLYKYTDAGISISFRLHDGCDNSYVWCGDERAYEIKEPWNAVAAIGVSSIVEGSDAEVPLTWLELDSDRYAEENGAEVLVKDFWELCDYVNAEACALWEEANSEDEEE